MHISSVKNNRQKRNYVFDETTVDTIDNKYNDAKIDATDEKKCNCSKAIISNKCPPGPPGIKGVPGHNGINGLPGKVFLIFTIV